MFCEYRLGKGDEWKAHPGHTLHTEEYDDDAEQESLRDMDAAGRNYTIFALLSGVRGNNRIIEEKEFPENLSPEVAAEYARWNGDAHSAGQCSLDALKKVLEAAKLEYAQEREYMIDQYKESLEEGRLTKKQYNLHVKMYDENEVDEGPDKIKIDDIFYCSYYDKENTRFPVPENKKFWDIYQEAGYVDIAPYLEKFIEENTFQTPGAEGLLDLEPEVRLVYWYDN